MHHFGARLNRMEKVMKANQIEALASALREKLEADGGDLSNKIHAAIHFYDGEKLDGDISEVKIEDDGTDLADFISNHVLDNLSENLDVDVTVKDIENDIGVTGNFYRETDETLFVGDERVEVADEVTETAKA